MHVVGVGTLELMTLFVNLVFRILASWFISQIHEKANLWVDETKSYRIHTHIRHTVHLSCLWLRWGRGVRERIMSTSSPHNSWIPGCVCVCVFQSSPLYVRAQRTEIRAEQLRNHVYSLEEETKTKVFLISHCSTGFLQLCLLVLLHIFNSKNWGQTSSSAACVSVCVTISSPCHTCRQWSHGWQPLCPEHFLVWWNDWHQRCGLPPTAQK